MITLARNEKGRASRAPAGSQRQSQPYPQQRMMSSPFRKIPSSPEPQKPRQAQWNLGLSDVLSLLLLGLQRDDLTPSQRCRGWILVERWLGQLVEARLANGAA